MVCKFTTKSKKGKKKHLILHTKDWKVNFRAIFTIQNSELGGVNHRIIANFALI